MSNKEKLVKGFENYLITSDGRIFSILRNKYLKTSLNGYGYLHATLIPGRKTAVIHRLVAEAFIPNPNNLPQINHKDCNKLNNNIENLEWVTCSENIIHAYKNNLMNTPRGENRWNTKLTWDDICEIRRIYSKKLFSQNKLAKKFGVDQGLISRIVNNIFWKKENKKLYV